MSYSKILEVPHGIHADVPEAVYHQRVHGVAGKGILDIIRAAPAKYRAWLAGVEEEETEALTFGKAFHMALLQPALFETTYVVEPAFGDCRKKDNKARRDEWRLVNADKLTLSPEDMTTIKGMVASVRAHPLAGRMVADGQPELTIRWADPDTGLECKARPDYYVRRLAMACDVKTTRDASFESFRRDAARHGYHRQDAFYRNAFAAVGAPIDHFVFIAVEKTAPHLVALYSLDTDDIRKGYASVTNDMARFRECLETDVWPGYEPTIQTLTLPPWAA